MAIRPWFADAESSLLGFSTEFLPVQRYPPMTQRESPVSLSVIRRSGANDEWARGWVFFLGGGPCGPIKKRSCPPPPLQDCISFRRPTVADELESSCSLRSIKISFHGFQWVLSGFTGCQWVLLDFIGFHKVLIGLGRFDWVSLGFTGFYWVLLGFTGFYWVLR